MGCGSSRMNSVEEAMPEKTRPLFFRRYEEITKHKQRPAAAMQRESTLSKKKLLKEDEDINSNSSDEAEAVYKPPITSPTKVEPTNKVVPLPDSDTEYETSTESDDHNGNNTTKQTPHEKEIDAEHDKDTREAQAENEHELADEKNNDVDDFDFGRLVCPGSPSFRIYCLPPQNDKAENKSQEMATHQKSSSVESVQSPASGHVKTPSVDSIRSAASSQNSKIFNECAETQSTTKRRTNRKKKFRDVKNILVVKSLYASCSCTGADRNRLVAAKAMK
ncbi:uncharacterized protein LOC129320526 [Prosopis cineraria]|uniref:uncharacterized protein LOC129298084 n=1 Tax=Prosopis cineraria TaxID=364024 RepID=UPI002410A705|nr:uncharacterized protein LOC129298084 [Prosopis cineraria]XP_054821999.1 uncharacterized protein LOC129320526 [Prosopis cineraria]